MYPVWLIEMFTGNTCPRCRRSVTLTDIEAVGACRPATFEPPREPLALIIATCRHCGQCIHFTTRCPKESLIDAVNELAAQIESAPATDPPCFGPGAAPASPERPASSDRASADPGTNPAVRPSVRNGQKPDPPSEAEIKSFLARLKRMSFKPGSKGFKKFTGSNPPDRSGGHADDLPKD